MSNRPHSRDKKVSNESVSANKHSFSSDGNSRSYNGRSSSNLSSAIGIIALLASLFKRKQNNNNYSTKKRSSLLSKIIKIVIIVVVLYYVFGFVKNLFSSVSNTVSNTVNNYVTNHSQSFDTNINSQDINNSSNSNARAKFTKIIGNGEDDVTVMVYMIGTDLESGYGCASRDIDEMYYADIKGNMNIVFETGGCTKWNNNYASNKYLQRYVINADGAYLLQGDLKSEPMTNPETLTSFIKYSAENFPANRYFLILWDHGGGSVTGYGYDEKYPYAESMSPDKIGKALRDSGVKFDVVGFDACLMANLETAIAIEPYADYMIASEETEPGDGWYYTDWLKLLDNNTSIPTVQIGRRIIDDYVKESIKYDPSAQVTESIIDLGELVANVKEPLLNFSRSTSDKLESNGYQTIANARGRTKEFSKSANLDQVDLVDLANNFNVDGSKELVEAIKASVKYNKTKNISNAYGLSAYFPYSSLSKMNDMVEIYENIDIEEEYAEVVKSFAKYQSSGQIVTQQYPTSSTSIFDILSGNNYYEEESYSNDDIFSILSGAYNNQSYGSYQSIFGNGYDSWFDTSSLFDISNYIGRNIVDTKKLNIIDKDGVNVVSLSDEEWNLIDNVTLNMHVDDGSGYIDLGMDNVFEWDDDGDLIVDSDKTWLTINGHLVSYYMVSDECVAENKYVTVGKIPAYLNGDRVDLIVEFSDEYRYGKVKGAKLIYEDSDTQQKGLIPIEIGDEIKFICNYYSYDGQFIDEYQLGDTLVVNSELTLDNRYIENKVLYTYCFLDIYGNKLFTPKTLID